MAHAKEVSMGLEPGVSYPQAVPREVAEIVKAMRRAADDLEKYYQSQGARR